MPNGHRPGSDGLALSRMRAETILIRSHYVLIIREIKRSFRRFPFGHLSTRQYARLVDEWVSVVGLDRRDYGTHSLRRTKASLIYKSTGNLRAVQILLGHTNIQNTVRYLGVDVDDAITLSERTEI